MNEMQKDLVLSINEYAYVLDRTKGNVSCWVGPVKTSLSTSDSLVRFNERTKYFEECSYDEAVNLFTTAPENWYVVLKNFANGNKHPTAGTANSLPENMNIGRKVNIRGPVSFALYPGQMAKVIRGHALRSNQYLLARVYEAESANKTDGEVLDAEGNKVNLTHNYVNGQILVIKGTEVSFYIPPTGIEVIPIENNSDKGFVRDAVTLERLEYCILKDEDGNKRYVHGPEVVFPEPTETFITAPNGSYIFKAIELSPISGIYVKVISEYDDVIMVDGVEQKVHHNIGDELFITGKDQMIYYPRAEHTMINYDGKIMHHAIAIPRGEGRYVMNRLTGEIKTVNGPAMYLPDPRYEVVVKRKLSDAQCQLWFPNNSAALEYNRSLSEKGVEKSVAKSTNATSTAFRSLFSSNAVTLDAIEANASISRGTSYSKPRTIMLDTKYDGVVAIDVWTGYAVNVISKDGSRKVVKGPQTILLDYDQTLEVLEMSTGKPKNTDKVIKTVYLRHENNKVSDLITVETKDFVNVTVKVSYCVDFDEKAVKKWFNVENYVKYLCDRERSLLKREAKNYTIEEFYQNYSDIVRNIAINATGATEGTSPRRYFEENGMFVHDCEVLDIKVEHGVAEMLEQHQREMVQQSLQLNAAEKELAVTQRLTESELAQAKIRSEADLEKIKLVREEKLRRLDAEAEIARRKEAEAAAIQQAQLDLQVVKKAIADAELAREQASANEAMRQAEAQAALEAHKKEVYAATVKTIIESISPELTAAMTANANSELLKAVAESMAPYALAKNESIADVTDKLLRGTPLEQLLAGMTTK